MATEYRWYFDDGTSVVTVTGYDNGHTQSHVFHSHGTYHVNVTVTNAAGSSQAFADVTVVGEFSLLLLPCQRALSQAAPSKP